MSASTHLHQKPKVWLKPGILLVYGSSLDAEEHSHHAIQIIFPKKKAVCHAENRAYNGNLIIGSQVLHRLALEEGWIILIEPHSKLGQRLNQYLDDQPIRVFSSITGHDVHPDNDENAPLRLFSPYLSMLKYQTNIEHDEPETMDSRIEQLIAQLDMCLSGQCQKPSSWRASDVAEQLGMSESRFLHLFKQHIGIAWRPYLRWRRLICAVYSLMKGEDATSAAHIAGFSDSAHLSRTFREMFGVSIRQVKQMLG
ncbi:AraC family transcriptional regulator [Photobacterium sanctipauli]|uniref:AraC family transcriptional regulator n=1 Tax=Photobacterium sanctipauli TaxID=1342794 RepID=A0A2T3P1E3_9GAMM|nr:helix-turn-helix transcriptional regulator [Photobacterium sanctipauli]PSW22327.1 AraC family transcriptional regulator [Photobacterium sanctipauli]